MTSIPRHCRHRKSPPSTYPGGPARHSTPSVGAQALAAPTSCSDDAETPRLSREDVDADATRIEAILALVGATLDGPARRGQESS